MLAPYAPKGHTAVPDGRTGPFLRERHAKMPDGLRNAYDARCPECNQKEESQS